MPMKALVPVTVLLAFISGAATANDIAPGGTPVEFKPVADPPAVIDAVSGGQADIGFVAYEPSRAGTVEFSQTYMLVQQSFLVMEGSTIRAIADVDRAGQKIAGGRNDSVT